MFRQPGAVGSIGISEEPRRLPGPLGATAMVSTVLHVSANHPVR